MRSPVVFSFASAAALLPTMSATAQSPDHDTARASVIIEQVATFDGPMPTGVSVASDGRIFVNFPRWGDGPEFTVAEVVNGRAVAYPDSEVNIADQARPARTLISVQSVVVDPAGRLWALDTAAPNFQTPIPGGAKLVAIDLESDEIVKTIVLPPDVILPNTYLNDVRFDLRHGEQGVAYITDSGAGGLLVVDLATGETLRRLSQHPATLPEPGFKATIDGAVLMNRPAKGDETPFSIASDALGLSPDGKHVYFGALSGRTLYSIPTALLRDADATQANLEWGIESLGHKGASDGIIVASDGRIFAGDYENNGIRQWADGTWSTLVTDERISWPDTLSIGPDGYLYFTANQLHRQPGFHYGEDKRRKPYELLRIRIDGAPVMLAD